MNSFDEYIKYQVEAERKYGENTIVFYENGTFYEIYGVDNDKEKVGQPKKVSEILNIALTRKSKKIIENSRKNPLLVGVPTAHAEKHIKTLIANGFTIVFVEQTSKPPNPTRGLTHVLSPTTYIADEYRSDNNYVLSIYLETMRDKSGRLSLGAGMCAFDLTVGDGIFYQLTMADNEVVFEEVFRFMEAIDPKEIVVNVENCENISFAEIRDHLELYRHKFYVRELKKDYYKVSYQNLVLAKVFPNESPLSPLEQLNLEMQSMATMALMLSIDFIYDHDERILRSLNPPREWEEKKHLILNNNTLYQLNIICDGSYGNAKSLFDIINSTKTIMGKRTLKNWMLNPIVCPVILERKYQILEKIIRGELWKKYDKILGMVFDLERFFRKMSIGYLLPHEMASFEPSLDSIKSIIELSESDFSLEDNNFLDFYAIDPDIKDQFLLFYQKYYDTFDLSILAQFGLNDINQSFFKAGVAPELDDIQKRIIREREYFEKEAVALSKLIDAGKNDCVKFDHNDRDGYFLRTTSKRGEILEKKLGKEFSTKKTGANVCRIISKKLEEANLRLQKAEYDIKDKVRDYFIKWCEDEYKENHEMFTSIVRFIATIDMTMSQAKICKENCYRKPQIIRTVERNSFVNAKGLRHPIIEKINQETLYVPNDIELNETGILLYGLNGGGKSSLLKAVGLAVVMAQMGMYVPAEEFIYYPFKTLYTRIMGNDNIFRGLSSFALEMTELRTILQYANRNSLILGDEICRGTEIHSALSIVSSACNILCSRKTNFLFATHLHKLHEIDVVRECKNLRHFYIDLIMENGRLIFGRKIYEGIGRKLYGLEVAEHIVENDEFLKLANKVRRQLLEGEILGNNEVVVSTKKSTYNQDLYVDECVICAYAKEESRELILYKGRSIRNGEDKECTDLLVTSGSLEVHRDDLDVSRSPEVLDSKGRMPLEVHRDERVKTLSSEVANSRGRCPLEVHRNDLDTSRSPEVWTSRGNRPLEVHHINSQKYADCDGTIDYFHKNHKGNLVVLCQEHHNQVHQGVLAVNGWVKTSDGVKLDWKQIEQKSPDPEVVLSSPKVHVPEKKEGLTDDIKEKIIGYKHLMKNLSLRVIHSKIEKDLGIKVTQQQIRKIFNEN